jgi:hypothetical protein
LGGSKNPRVSDTFYLESPSIDAKFYGFRGCGASAAEGQADREGQATGKPPFISIYRCCSLIFPNFHIYREFHIATFDYRRVMMYVLNWFNIYYK